MGLKNIWGKIKGKTVNEYHLEELAIIEAEEAKRRAAIAANLKGGGTQAKPTPEEKASVQPKSPKNTHYLFKKVRETKDTPDGFAKCYEKILILISILKYHLRPGALGQTSILEYFGFDETVVFKYIWAIFSGFNSKYRNPEEVIKLLQETGTEKPEQKIHKTPPAILADVIGLNGESESADSGNLVILEGNLHRLTDLMQIQDGDALLKIILQIGNDETNAKKWFSPREQIGVAANIGGCARTRSMPEDLQKLDRVIARSCGNYTEAQLRDLIRGRQSKSAVSSSNDDLDFGSATAPSVRTTPVAQPPASQPQPAPVVRQPVAPPPVPPTPPVTQPARPTQTPIINLDAFRQQAARSPEANAIDAALTRLTNLFNTIREVGQDRLIQAVDAELSRHNGPRLGTMLSRSGHTDILEFMKDNATMLGILNNAVLAKFILTIDSIFSANGGVYETFSTQCPTTHSTPKPPPVATPPAPRIPVVAPETEELSADDLVEELPGDIVNDSDVDSNEIMNNPELVRTLIALSDLFSFIKRTDVDTSATIDAIDATNSGKDFLGSTMAVAWETNIIRCICRIFNISINNQAVWSAKIQQIHSEFQNKNIYKFFQP